MILIGINEGLNASVVVLKDGEIVFALQEERLNKIKEYCGFPEEALAFTLDYLKLSPKDIEAVCLSNFKSPVFTRDQFRDSYELRANKPYRNKILFKLEERIRRYFEPRDKAFQTVKQHLDNAGLGDIEIIRKHHHLMHAASAYYGMRENATDEHLVLTLDGGGDKDCAHIYRVKDNQFDLIAKTKQGNSVGNLYSSVTHFMGMKPHEHEYKLMGLAAYAKSDYYSPVVDKFRQYLDLDESNPLVFKRKIPEPTSNVGYRLQKDFKRVRFDNMAGGIQAYTEDLMLRWVLAAVEKTGISRVVVAGGVFMNVKANKIIAENDKISFFDVMPSCGDETLPFGCVWHEFALRAPEKSNSLSLKTFCLGPTAHFDLQDVMNGKDADKLNFEELSDPHDRIATLIADGKIVARCAGPMEFGARALGNRTLMADASRTEIIPIINKIIKKRDFWMPFAPALLKSKAEKYLKIPKALKKQGSPFMMHTYDTTDKRVDFVAGAHAYDNTSRAQTVTKESNPDFLKILENFESKTGKAVCLNTSFNLHGLPIVMGAKDAVHVLMNSGLEYLVVENTLITKKEA